jgi:outer membrane protein
VSSVNASVPGGRRGALALAVLAVIASGSVAAPSNAAVRTPHTVARASATPAPVAPVQPTPYPVKTLGPLNGVSPAPYPAYGSPAPGVDAGVPAPGIPVDISLAQAIDIGFARSPALASARADVGVQAAAVRLARAGLLPSLSATGSYDKSHQQPGSNRSSSGGTIFAGSVTNFSSASIGLSLRQLIYDGGKIAASVNAAQRGETAFADTYRRDLQTVAYNVAVAYYNYLAAERTTQVEREILRQDLVQEDLVRAQVKAGTEARAQIATVQLPSAQARVAVVRAQGNELAAEAAFANAMGLDANVRVQPIDDAPVFTNAPVSTIPIPAYDAALKRALALRPDYDASLQSVAQANENLRAAKLGLFPTLAGTASANDSSTDTNAGSFRNSQTVGVSLSIPLFDQGVTAANTAQARASLDRANAQLQNAALGIGLNVKQSLTSLVSARASLDQTEQEYATAVTNLQSTQAQYRAGVTTLPLLLNAQVQLTQALTDQVNAVYELRQAEQAYLFAVGANYDTSGGLGTTSLPIPKKS